MGAGNEEEEEREEEEVRDERTFWKRPFLVGKLLITPHPQAPILSDRERVDEEFLRQVADEFASGRMNEEGMRLIREFMLVSYWFFVQSALRVTGAFDGLEDDLSVDMCNFRQSEYCMAPGAKAAVFMPRGFSKSRVNTIGATVWELTRNPDLSVVVANAIRDRAMEFLNVIGLAFSANEVMELFFPEHVVKGGNGKFTSEELVLPSRRIKGGKSVKPIGVGGAAEGGHYDLIVMDDIVGLDAIRNTYQISAAMETARKWFKTNRRALRNGVDSRLLVVATRYAVDDCYSEIYESCKKLVGWRGGDIVEREGGEWVVYYRLVEENGVFLRPEVMDERELGRIMEEDPWVAMTQYYNQPTRTGHAEFADYPVHRCELKWESGKYWVVRADVTADEEEGKAVSLDSCSVVIATDLAATEKGVTPKTCRSAIEVWALDAWGNYYFLWGKVGYFDIVQSIDYIFEANRLFRGYVEGTIIETNAFQKVLAPWLREEQRRRGEWFTVVPVAVKVDKKVRIRNTLSVPLTRGQVWCTDQVRKWFVEESKLFPLSDTRMDVLDAAEKAVSFLKKPMTAEERIMMEIEEREERLKEQYPFLFGDEEDNISLITGY